MSIPCLSLSLYRTLTRAQENTKCTVYVGEAVMVRLGTRLRYERGGNDILAYWLNLERGCMAKHESVSSLFWHCLWQIHFEFSAISGMF